MKEMTALEAKFEAQKLAFGPIYFQAIITMKDLGILDILQKNKKGIAPEQISAQLNISHYGVQVLLEAALSADLVAYDEEGLVHLTKVGLFVNFDEMTRVNLNFVNDVCYEGAKYLTDSIKNEKPEGLKVFGNWDTVYEGLSQLPEKVKKSWFEFDHYYSDDAFKDALEIVFGDNPPGYIYDVGGNTGKWALACCSHHPGVKVKIVDLPGQLAVAQKNVEANNLLDRIDFYETNVLDKELALPDGADVFWMSQFLDCFSEDEILLILNKASKASEKGTLLYILEPFYDNQEFPAAQFCLTGTSLYFTTIANGNSKMYSIEVMNKLVEEAGFKVVQTYPLIGDSYHTLLKCQKV